jgi:hypothetical protein
MEASGQLHVLAALLPEKELPVLIGLETEWAGLGAVEWSLPSQVYIASTAATLNMTGIVSRYDQLHSVFSA